MNEKVEKAFRHGKSKRSQMILAAAAEERGCQCVAYVDWFTYDLWQSMGYQVQRGQHGIPLVRHDSYEKTDKQTGKVTQHHKRVTSHNFCRCQVMAKVDHREG